MALHLMIESLQLQPCLALLIFIIRLGIHLGSDLVNCLNEPICYNNLKLFEDILVFQLVTYYLEANSGKESKSCCSVRQILRGVQDGCKDYPDKYEPKHCKVKSKEHSNTEIESSSEHFFGDGSNDWESPIVLKACQVVRDKLTESYHHIE